MLMIKKFISFLLLFILLSMPSEATWYLSKEKFTPSADYTPATAEVEWVDTGGSGTELVIAIYDSSEDHLTNGTSAAIGETTGWASASFTNCDDLTPGGTYYVAVICDNYCKLYSNSNYGGSDKSATYPTAPSDLSGSSGQEYDEFNFRIKNAGGDVLLSETGNTEEHYFVEECMWTDGGYTCTTL